MNPLERMTQASEHVREALKEHRAQCEVYAKANRAYHRERAKAYIAATGTIDERRAHADIVVEELRFKRDLSEGLRQSALEAVRAQREDLGMWRSYVAAAREGVVFGMEEEA